MTRGSPPDAAEDAGGARAASFQAKRSSAAVLADWTRALAATASIATERTRTLPVIIEEVARERPAAPALLSDRESFSYSDLASRMTRVARWAMAAGLSRGDTVALLMENRPDYLAIWLGLTRIGICVALLNTNLRGAALAHCIGAAQVKGAIVSSALIAAWDSAAIDLPSALPLWPHGFERAGASRLDTALPGLSDTPFEPAECPTTRDRALLIYTSGTTGLPKAANVSHGRVLSWALWFAGMLDTGPADRMYDCLPLYHSVGGVVATGALLARGGSVVIAPGFSASRFWHDVRRWDCTLAQYIGELCRYLLAGAVDPQETAHRLRALCGNGLRADVWRPFEARFKIPRIVEFYAASEGTFSLYNVEGEAGAIGRVPSFLRHRFPAAIVRFDEATGGPARSGDGRCLRAEPGETGEAIGRIANGGAGQAVFEGYTDAQASERKILRNVFADGDAWMRTGDLMRLDARGFWYFVDRIGDTFRWKGENVATLEVADAVRACPGVLDAIVYGVAVPGTDGRAGMAALTVAPGFDPQALAGHLEAALPAYARPVFLRLTAGLETTGTFKHQTRALVDEGFDPGRTQDRLFVWDRAMRRYAMLDGARYDAISRGDMRV